jgi:hypothetical protein
MEKKLLVVELLLLRPLLPAMLLENVGAMGSALAAAYVGVCSGMEK